MKAPPDILRRLTKPMTVAQSEAMVRARYGVVRENVSSDDPVAVRRAAQLLSVPRKGTTTVKSGVKAAPKSKTMKVFKLGTKAKKVRR